MRYEGNDLKTAIEDIRKAYQCKILILAIGLIHFHL